MRDRVTVQTPVETQNEFGEYITTWQTLDTAWAEVVCMSGREYFQAKQTQAELTHRVVMRYRAITPLQRLTFGNSILDIQSVVTNKKAGMIQLMCIERLPTDQSFNIAGVGGGALGGVGVDG